MHHWQEDGGIVCPDPFDLTTCYRDVIPHADLLRAQDFSYDAVGNRTDLGAVLEPGNRLTSFNGTTLGYDADGNLTSKTKPGFTQTLTWNTRGQLVSVTTNGVTTTFGYDGFGRRVRKTTGATTTRYFWDGDDLVLELDGAGNPAREYSHFPGADHPFAVRRSSDGAVFYYAGELPGHVAGLINSADQVVNTYEYDPWGQALGTTEQVPQPLEYGGREYDSETGFYYNRARYYDPQLGRFISEDPIGLAGGINPYGYAGEDPGNGRDPSGLVIVLDAITVVGDAPCDEFWYWASHPDICPGPPPDPGAGGAGGGFPPLVGGHGGGGGQQPQQPQPKPRGPASRDRFGSCVGRRLTEFGEAVGLPLAGIGGGMAAAGLQALKVGTSELSGAGLLTALRNSLLYSEPLTVGGWMGAGAAEVSISVGTFSVGVPLAFAVGVVAGEAIACAIEYALPGPANWLEK